MAEESYKLDFGKAMNMKYAMYVLGLKKNLFSISALVYKRGFIVTFVDGKFLMWSKGKTIDDVVEIGVEEGGLYKLKGHVDSTLETNTIIPCELWHRRLAHIYQMSTNGKQGCDWSTRNSDRT